MNLRDAGTEWLARIARGTHDPLTWYPIPPRLTPIPELPRISSPIRVDGYRIALSGRDAQRAAFLLGCRLPTAAEVLRLAAWPHVPMVTRDISTPARAREYDNTNTVRAVSQEIDHHIVEAGPFNGGADYSRNEGKHPTWDATPFGLRLAGWWRDDGTLVQLGSRDQHNESHVDYSQTVRLISEDTADRRDRMIECAMRQPANPSPRLLARYFAWARTRSDGLATGYAPGWDYCAAGASYCAASAGYGHALTPHGYRMRVWEMVADARDCNLWVERIDAQAIPGLVAGDLLLGARAGGDPRRAGQTGHVERIIFVDHARRAWQTRSANSPGWVTRWVAFDDPRIVGGISYGA